MNFVLRKPITSVSSSTTEICRPNPEKVDTILKLHWILYLTILLNVNAVFPNITIELEEIIAY